ncbi:hypothetical protein GS453_11545 [Rhodococcus hoagii]|uniref:Uncharacterized protein n=2 Tax=Rhodococcus hoagii TaxID=43767 RepID=A0AAE5MI66_RHOHA|nr:DUF6308 family protein [Prescottella equi]MBM4627505.1 hypothetical protein [Prescottella equi]ORL27774.1 hypothetical protein A6I89_12035 [Prescottella equi]ORM01401.1 hypothetical protein A5N73_11725 [Prescottella equi]ORM25267.1 hypothetical protein A5N68_14950 [Prescottella equi]QPQ78774.1 hypothetical protein I6H09_08355 [Prescottella equi]
MTDMTIRLPKVLVADDDGAAVEVLRRYFTEPLVKTGYLRSGARWDTWDSTGTRGRDADTFTADDLVAVTMLSVDVSPDGAQILLRERVDEFGELLVAVGPDRDLADEADELTPESPVCRLEAALWTVPSIGRTVASKLIARKRPRLFPIYDRVIGEVLDTKQAHLESVRTALRADDGALQRRLVSLRERAGLDEAVPALRILTVLAWMQLKSPQ